MNIKRAKNCPFYLVFSIDGSVAVYKMIMAAVQSGYTLKEMYMTSFYLNIRAGYY